MATYAICYDLNSPGQDYADLHEAIKDLGAWWHHLDSTWLVVANLSMAAVRDHLDPFLDQDDELLVIDITGDPAGWRGFSKRASDWLEKHI